MGIFFYPGACFSKVPVTFHAWNTVLDLPGLHFPVSHTLETFRIEAKFRQVLGLAVMQAKFSFKTKVEIILKMIKFNRF